MKPTRIVVLALLLVAGLALAQTPPAQQPAAAAAQPAKKGPPQAKTQDELTAYNAAVQLLQGQDPAAAEAAINTFAVQYAQSDLRVLLYQSLMNLYQNANNGDKVVDVGRKVLAIDGDNPIPMVMIATVLSERTRDSDLDKDERLAEAVKDARRALQTIDSLPLPPGTPPDRAAAAKATVASMSHSALGTVATVQQNWGEAEKELRLSVETPGIPPDPLTMLRLCITLDHLKKYAEALQMSNQTVDVATKTGQTAVQQLAQQERDRLVKLTAGPPPAAAAPPATGANPPAAPPAKPPQER